MSFTRSELRFKIIEGTTHVSVTSLLLVLWERFADHTDNGYEDKGEEVRDIIEELMEAKP